MAKSTHEKQLARARARRAQERAERRRATTTVVSVVAGLVVFAVALAGVLLVRGRAADDVADDAAFATDDAPTGGASSAELADDAAAAADTTTGDDESAAGVEPCPVASGSLPTPTTTPYATMPSADLDGADALVATLRTTCGDIVVQLDAAAAPTTVANFVGLAQDGYYEGVGFHRVIDGFMIQGGDPTGTGSGCLDAGCTERLPGYTFDDELALAEEVVDTNGGYPRGTLAMANAGADTNGSQFFVVQSDRPYPLPPDYAVFGEVLEGMDVVDRIAVGPAEGDQAIDPVIILGVDVEI